MLLFETKLSDFPKISGVYKITCIANNKFYIGSAISLRKRLKEHRNLLLLGKCHCSYLQNCFNKYGKDSLEVEFLQIFDKLIEFKSTDYKEKLIKAEEYYISSLHPALNSQMNPYSNFGDTGNSIPIYQYDLEGNFIKEWSSQAEVSRVLGFNPQAAFTHQSAGGFQWSKEKVDKMPVYRRQSGIKSKKVCSLYNLLGQKIKTFDCLVDCGREIFPKDWDRRKILNNIQRLIRTSKGYNDKYRVAKGDKEQLDNSINLKHQKNYIVVQYDKSGNFINVFQNISHAFNRRYSKDSYQIVSDKNGYDMYITKNYIFKRLGS